MDYKVNARFVERVLEIKEATHDIAEDMDSLRRFIDSNIHSEEDRVKFILAGYMDAMEDAANLANVDLDMTYETAGNLMPALIALAHLQKSQGYDNQKNAELTTKTLSAYLTLLAINNHKVSASAGSKSNRRKENRPEFWSDRYYLRLNNKKESDLLPYVVAGINTTQIEVDNGFTLDIRPLLGAYRRITDVDLTDYGFANLIIDFDEITDEE